MPTDDSFTATQLRARYGRGGSKADDELSASQLRSRHEIETNSFRIGGNVKLIYALVFAIIGISYIIRSFYAKTS
jgi:hypothetical protein